MGVHLTQLITESVKASIHVRSYAMMALSVTPPTKDEGAEVDEAVEAERAIISI